MDEDQLHSRRQGTPSLPGHELRTQHRGAPRPGGQTSAVPLSVDSRAAAIGRDQFGLCARDQLRAAGVATRTIHRRLIGGQWSEPVRGVISIRTHAPSWNQDLMVVMLAARTHQGLAWASHRTAARLHRLPDVTAPREHHVTLPRTRRRQLPGTRIHLVKALPEDERTRIGPFPTTSLARTLLDLAAELPRQHLEPILWEAARCHRDLAVELAHLATRHHRRPGTPAIADLLRGLHPDIAAAGSPFEVHGLLALRDPKLPPPTLQHEIRDAQGRVVRRVDAAWPGSKVAIEFDGRAYHQTPSQLAKDRRQREALRRLGWVVLELRAEDLRGAQLGEVRAALCQLLTTR